MLSVEQEIKFLASDTLLMICSEAALAASRDCSICLGVEEAATNAVHVPCCRRAFHSDCIAKWFDRKSSCPMCRRDLRIYLDPRVQKFFQLFE